jgi:hypothetical protein
VSYSLDIDHLVHYGIELKQPLFLILADVDKQRLFFFSPQLVAKEIASAQNGGKQSLTVRVSARCELPANAKSMLETLKKLYLVLSSRELISSSAVDFQSSLTSLADQEALYTAFQEKNDLLRLHRIHADYKLGKTEDALRRAATVRDDNDASIAVRFHAVTQMNAIEWSTSLRAGVIGPALAKPSFDYARRLRALMTPEHRWLRFAAMMVEVGARLEQLILGDGADYMTLQQHIHADNNPLVILGLYARRTATAKLIVRKYNQGVRLARLASGYTDRWALGSVLPRIPLALASYLATLRSSSDVDTEKAFVDSSLGILNLAVQIARELGDLRMLATAATAALSLSNINDSDPFIWCQKQVQGMPEGDEKAWAIDSIRRTVERRDGTPQDGDYNPDPHWQIIQKLALSLNVDISDDESLLVKRLRIAVRDNNPENLLRFCEHVVVTLGAVSPTARYITEVFGLSTGANKVIHCNLLDLHEEDIDADSAFSAFTRIHCATCSYRIPRSPQWSYSPGVRKAFEQENLPFVKQSAFKGKGLRLTNNDDLDAPIRGAGQANEN